MSYVPKLEEEEALILILRVLADERRGQATVRELKEIIEHKKPRPWSDEDAAKNVVRSGAPMWHQIVQNAADRLDADRHFYRASFIRIISISPQKVLQITEEGRKFVEDLNRFEERLLAEGFTLYEYLDKSPLDAGGAAWRMLKEKLKKRNIPYEAGSEIDDLLRSLRSREYAEKHHLDYENADLHMKISAELKSSCDEHVARSIDAWTAGRKYIGKLANLNSKRDELLENLELNFNWPAV